MRLTNSGSEYGLVMRMLHWTIALAVLAQFVGGVADVEDEVHASIGLLVLALVTLRLLWRLLVPLPDWAPVLTAFERKLIGVYEKVIYAMLFAKPVTGLFLLSADEGEIELLGDVSLPGLLGESDRFEDLFESLHFWSGVVLLIALVLHIGLVLRHQVWLKDGLLRRMWPAP